MEWQDISTAPKGTKAILVYCSDRKNTYIVTWGQAYGFLGNMVWKHFGGHADLNEIPTHWMPLPQPPIE